MLPLIALAAATMAVDAHRGRDRLLVVFAPGAASPALAAQRAAIDGPELAERDLHVVEVVGDSVMGASDRATALRARCHVAANAFRAVLIGKDGGVKLSSAAPLTTARLTATIDAMPMRQAEMRR